MQKFKRVFAIVIAAVLCITALGGCGKGDGQPGSDATRTDLTLILIADGQIVVATSDEAESIADVLAKAGVVLHEGDMLSVNADQILTSGMVVEVLRHAAVQIVLTAKTGELTYNISLVGATVGEALKAVGIDLTDITSLNYDMDEPLVDGMEIQVSSTVAPILENQGADGDDGSDGSDGGWTGGWTGGYTGGGTSEPATPERTVVSVERYDDCDGSGHGVMVITYSDGTQEEQVY